MKHKHFIIYIALLLTYRCMAQVVIRANDPHIRYSGRIAMQDSAAILSWSGTSVKINFEGNSISYRLRDEGGNNYYNIIIDGKISSEHKPYNTVSNYTLKNLAYGKHSLELFKCTEWAMGKTWFYGFTISKGGRALAPPVPKKRKMEFFGNSITCGYADEDTTGQDRGTAVYENGYLSYAAITARHFDAEFYNTSKSGIGVTVSWFPLIMPEMYDRLDANDSTSKWDFSKYRPRVVVINLFQNDSWLVNMPGNPQFKARFGTQAPTPQFLINAYRDFVRNIRSKYPEASILCILGSMDATKPGSPWPGYIKQAVEPLNDKKIYVHMIPYKNTPGHPSIKEQQAMADDLIAFMDKNISW